MRKTFLLFCIVATVSLGVRAQSTLPYQNKSLPVEERVKDLLGRMTLEEKIAQMRHIHSYSVMTDGRIDEDKLDKMIGGKNYGFIEGITLPGKECLALMKATQQYMKEKTRLGIPVFALTESLHGSVHDGSTIFPQAIALGSTFNPRLAYEMTSAISRELTSQGITQSLTPVIDVCRDLRWGRVEECFGEDPFLVSRMGVSEVKGYLENGISPMLKHFGAHGTPTGGLNLSSVACGERELLSIYLKTFETVVKEAKPWAVMSSYNSWNNEPNSSSSFLMTELLRNRWGFKGYVYSDWGSIGMLDYFHHTARNGAEAAIQALTAGLDAEASDDCYAELQQLVENGKLDVKYIDRAVGRILTAKFSMGLFEYSFADEKDYDKVVHAPAHVALSRRIAEESMVLLQNNGNLLPLDAAGLKSVAVIGPNADQVQFGDYTWSRDNKDGVTLCEALREMAAGRFEVNYAKGRDLVTDNKDGF
ncbi:MAG: glycoside hydrolase family 3 protein, partial [Bacteroidaceae bacterium]